MSRTGLLILITALASECVCGRDWYAAPDARLDGDGSLGAPWALQIALMKTASIQPGDTLYLRGGSYRGPGFISTLSGTANSYVVVRSFPGEWAVVTDGGLGRLVGTLGAGTPYSITSGVLISGSEFWSPGTIASIDSEQVQINARGNSPTNWSLVRGWNGTSPTSHSSGAQVKIRASFIEHSGSYVMFRDFEITGTASANRVVNSTHYLGCGLNLSASGNGNKAVNLIIHNVGHPGIGFWDQGIGGEVNGCLVWGVGIYDNNGAWTRGSALYGQNSQGTILFKNNMSFRNFTTGMELYGETGPVKNSFFRENIFFDHPLYSTEAASGSTPTTNNWFISNWLMGSPLLSYVSLSNTHQFFCSNVIVNGSIFIKETRNSAYTNNTFLLPANAGVGGSVISYSSDHFARNEMNIQWDRNSYYLGSNSSPYNWTFRAADLVCQNSSGGGNLKFRNDNGKAWQDVTGLDPNSIYSTNWPADYLVVEARALDYDSNRFHVVVISTSGQTNASLSLLGLGFVQGEQYILRDAQDYFRPVATGIWSGGALNLPLNRTNLATINGTLTHYTNSHTNVRYPGLFNAFVLSRTPALRPAPPANLRVVTSP